MTLRLILTRHAKSSWDDPHMSDHDRPLNKRGRESALAIGRWLSVKGLCPDEVFVSSAERTRETWNLISRAGCPSVAPEIAPSLYLAEPDTMLNVLKGATGKTVMMIGHNPGTTFAARGLLDTPPATHLFDRYPTGATAVMDFEIDRWEDLIWRMGELVDFVVPRDLVAAEEALANEPPALSA
ncbi:histidine phosphatase family protein [Maritimibacter sp. UBA3975]|uniref:SixA phosphatase family protein n=1 Tax=Maritimibacter sp. UBA3975 TaxID=1946833 RepID=UPI000C0AAF8C|nr:histidine phosphatase family protein [Maritimibacter sp. UBA3975]MAM63825.1 phosphoglycerate mutase [Maritimibacter sp.]|tara:strand:+ start:111563 stop:112111 length:549 start_codon:yes stop_codon:yes gene_type:complete